jgi:hypothetical protein
MKTRQKKYIECSMQYCGKKVIVRFDKKWLSERYKDKFIQHQILNEKLPTLKTYMHISLLNEMSEAIKQKESIHLIHFG